MIVSALLKQSRLIETKVHCTFCYSVRTETTHILSKVAAAKKNFSIEVLLVILKIWLWKVWWCPAFDILRLFDCLQLSHLLPEKQMRSHCSFMHTFEKTFSGTKGIQALGHLGAGALRTFMLLGTQGTLAFESFYSADS